MHDEQQGQNVGLMESLKNNVNMGLGLAQSLAGPVEAVLHHAPGDRYHAGHTAFGTIIMFIAIALGGGPYAGQIAIGAVAVVALALVSHKSQRRKLEAKGARIPSRYSGQPSRWFGKDELSVKGRVEPAFAVMIGMFCLPLSMGLGGYLMVAGCAMALSVAADRAAWEARKRAIQDSMIEQQIMAEEVRNWRGE